MCNNKILLIGYGNPGRLDDGLGPALAAKIEAKAIEGLSVDSDYQLTVENAFDVSKYESVIFADASINGEEPFSFQTIQAQSPMSFSTHSVSPEAILFFAKTMFQAQTKAYLLGIRGYEFNEFEERLSEGAQRNLDLVFDFIIDLVQSGNLHNYPDCQVPCSRVPAPKR